LLTSDIGPGEYRGSDYLLQAQKLYERGDPHESIEIRCRPLQQISDVNNAQTGTHAAH